METFPRYCPFVRSPVNSPHRGQWRRASMFSLICAWTKGWTNHRDSGDLRCRRAHYNVTLMEAMECFVGVWSKFVSIKTMVLYGRLTVLPFCSRWRAVQTRTSWWWWRRPSRQTWVCGRIHRETRSTVVRTNSTSQMAMMTTWCLATTCIIHRKRQCMPSLHHSS